MHNNENNSKLSLNKSSVSSSNIKPLSRFQKRAQEQAQAQQQRELSASKERKVEATPWTKGSLMSQNKDQDRFGERKERSFGERRERGPRRDGERSFGERFERGPRRDGERSFGERRERGPRREGERSFGERRERGPRREDRGGARRERAPRMDAQNLYDVAGDFDSSNSRPERVVTDARTIYECEVPIGRMTELAICEITEKGAFVDAKDHGPLFIPRSQLPDEAQEGDLIRVFLYKDGERTLATARRPYIELGMTGNLRINSVENGTAYLDLGIPKELVLPVSEQRFRMYEGDNALVLVCIDNLGRLFGTQCFNRYIRDKSFPHEFEDNQRVKIVAVAHTPLGFRVIVDDKVYGLIYQSEQKGELIIGKRYDGFVKTVRPDGRLDISLQEAGREGVEHASLDILQALYFSEGKFDFNDKSEPEKIEEYLKMSKGRFKKALGALYKQRFVEITDDGVLLTPEGQNFANERFAHLANKGQSNIDSDSDSDSDSNGLADSVESSYDDMDALANADVGADQDPMVDAVVSAVAQARKEGKLPTGYHNNEVKSYQRSDFNNAEPEQALETTSWGENLDELGDFAGRRSAVNEMSGFGNERSAHRHDRGPRRDGERRERSPRRERSFGERRERSFGERGPRREGERRERSFGERRERGFGERGPRRERSFGERRERSFGERHERSFGERRERGPRRDSHSFRGKR